MVRCPISEDGMTQVCPNCGKPVYYHRVKEVFSLHQQSCLCLDCIKQLQAGIKLEYTFDGCLFRVFLSPNDEFIVEEL